MNVLRRKCAARLIQLVWRQYKCRMLMEQISKKEVAEEFIAKIGRRRERMKITKAASGKNSTLKQNRLISRGVVALATSEKEHRNRRSNVRLNLLFRALNSCSFSFRLEKEFQLDETATTTTHISRKLDSLENLVRRGGQFRKKSSQVTFVHSRFIGNGRIFQSWLTDAIKLVNEAEHSECETPNYAKGQRPKTK